MYSEDAIKTIEPRNAKGSDTQGQRSLIFMRLDNEVFMAKLLLT